MGGAIRAARDEISRDCAMVQGNRDTRSVAPCAGGEGRVGGEVLLRLQAVPERTRDNAAANCREFLAPRGAADPSARCASRLPIKDPYGVF